MLESISPYALLCASKPRQPRSVTTQYDVFSLSQANSASAVPASSPAGDPPAQRAPAQSLPEPNKRTHYIADIHARHSSAMRRTPQSIAPL